MTDSTRTEFGWPRTSCGCNSCIENCRHMPGMLIPADLERMIPDKLDPFTWAETYLLASPGALVMNTATLQPFRVPTLVPAIQADGSCIHLTTAGRCAIHAVAPFGCAFFDCGPERGELSREGIIAIMNAHRNDELYSRIWQHLWNTGKRQKPPEELRSRYSNPLPGNSS